MTTRPKILVAEGLHFSAPAADRLRQVAEVVLADVDRAALLGMLRDTDVLWVRLRTRIDAEVLNAAPRLGAVVTPTTGMNHIDADEAGRRGIRVLSLRGETEFLSTVSATAEHTLGLVLALLRHIPAAAVHAAQGGWARDAFRGRELQGMTVGVIGYGRLGRQVSSYLRVLGAHLIACDPLVPTGTSAEGIGFMGLDDVLARAELVLVHASAQPGAPPILGAHEFGRMRPGASLVNTARGELIDEAALLQALQSGRLSSAALDVLADEQRAVSPQHPLLMYARQHDNLIVTPHLGGCTAEAMEKTECFMAERLAAHLESERR